MKIRGNTTTTPIARHAVTDDTAVSKKPWSSKNTVDKLCPAFTESGYVVTCEPVEGYPLTATPKTGTTVHRCGKNLINPPEYMSASDNRSSLDGDVFTTNFESGGLHLNVYWNSNPKWHQPGTYTLSFLPLTEGAECAAFIYGITSAKTIAKKTTLSATDPYFTFTANEAIIISIAGNNVFYGNCSYRLQLEAGKTATAYEPYNGAIFAQGEQIPALHGVNTLHANTGSITVDGRTDPTAIIEKLTNAIISLGGNV